MKVKTLSTRYNLLEFHHYIDEIEPNELISVLELLIESTDLNSIEKDFTNIFVIETNNQSYVFSNYTISEFYIVDDKYIRISCVK